MNRRYLVTLVCELEDPIGDDEHSLLTEIEFGQFLLGYIDGAMHVEATHVVVLNEYYKGPR